MIMEAMPDISGHSVMSPIPYSQIIGVILIIIGAGGLLYSIWKLSQKESEPESDGE